MKKTNFPSLPDVANISTHNFKLSEHNDECGPKEYIGICIAWSISGKESVLARASFRR